MHPTTNLERAASLFRLYRNLSSHRVRTWAARIYRFTFFAIAIWFLGNFLFAYYQFQQRPLSERVAQELIWHDAGDFFAHPVQRYLLVCFFALFALQLFRGLAERVFGWATACVCQSAADRGSDAARFTIAEYRIGRAGRSLEFGGAPPSLPEHLEFRPRVLARMLTSAIRWYRRDIEAAARERHLRRALAALEDITLNYEDAGRARYRAGQILVRGLASPDQTAARERFRVASIRGIPEGAFEYALLLLSPPSESSRREARTVLNEALPRLRAGVMRDRALFELARLARAELDSDRPKFALAQEYLTEMLHAGAGAEAAAGEDSAAAAPPALETAMGLRAAARTLYQQNAADLRADAANRLAQVEREKREAVENLMAMFAHQFRGSVGTILFNAEHQHDHRLYLSLARSMSGLLEMFSVVSTSPEKLQSSLKMDASGDQTLTGTLHRALMLALIQLLSIRNRHRMSPHFLAYAKRLGAAPPGLRLSEWVRDREWQAIERETRLQWEQEAGSMFSEASLENVCRWAADHILPIGVEGFAESRAQFTEFGPKASVLTVVLTEILVNAIKHAAAGVDEPIRLRWTEGQGECCLTCVNPSTRDSRMREASKGSGRGLRFLALIAEHLGGRFTADVFSDTSQVAFFIPTTVMYNDEK